MLPPNRIEWDLHPADHQCTMRFEQPLAMAPIGRDAALLVARWRCNHFTTLATLTPNKDATSRQLRPDTTAAGARSRKSFE